MWIAVNEQFNIMLGNRRFKGLVIYGVAIIVTAVHRNSDDSALCIAGTRIKCSIYGREDCDGIICFCESCDTPHNACNDVRSAGEPVF